MNSLRYRLVEPWIFFLITALHSVPVIIFHFFPTVDGPCHLYSANIIRHLLVGGSAFSKFFSLNPIPVPNWISHFILVVFGCFLPDWLAEKLLLLCFVFGFPYSFRYLIFSLNPTPYNGVIYAIFPLIYSFLFFMGFFNLIISFIFLALAVGYWERNRLQMRNENWFTVAALLIILYFSHIFSFCLSLVIIGLIELLSLLGPEIKNPAIFIKRWTRLFMVYLLPIFLAFIYFISIHIPSTAGSDLSNEIRFRMLFCYNGNWWYMTALSGALLITLLYNFYRNCIVNSGNNIATPIKMAKRHFWLLLIIPLLILFFCLPDYWNAGMMCHRLLLAGIILIVVWIAGMPLDWRWSMILTITFTTLSFLKISEFWHREEKLAADAAEIAGFASLIDAGKTVIAWNNSDDWQEGHLCDYLAADKAIILLDNYEAATGWFPVLWRKRKPDRIIIDDHQSNYPFYWEGDPEKPTRFADYVFLYSPRGNIISPQFTAQIGIHYRLLSTSNNCRLYKLCM